MTGQSTLTVFRATGIGSTIAVTPSTRARLAMLEPITFPIDISGEPLNAALHASERAYFALLFCDAAVTNDA